MRRPPSRDFSYAFGPGPLSPAIKALVVANVVMFVLIAVLPGQISTVVVNLLGLRPNDVMHGWVWQLVTYMFLHGGLAHIFFNMLALWMFGTELERLWGTRAFLRYFFLTGIAAGVTTIIVALLPFGFTAAMFYSVTIGASGAIYGLLLAYGLTFPNRPLLL